MPEALPSQSRHEGHGDTVGHEEHEAHEAKFFRRLVIFVNFVAHVVVILVSRP